MSTRAIEQWIQLQERPEVILYIKRLSANDTLANGSHQAGPYIAKRVLFSVFPDLNRPDQHNPDHEFELQICPHKVDPRMIRAIWYNNKLRGRSRDEARLTRFGGSSSPLLNPENTGSIAVFAFHQQVGRDPGSCEVWLTDLEEEFFIEERFGPIIPGEWFAFDNSGNPIVAERKDHNRCWLSRDEFPPKWLLKFPTGEEIVKKSLELCIHSNSTVDNLLLARRRCEFDIFQSLEEAIELPVISAGFDSVAGFIKQAQTILQRRKVRSGRSLELHLRTIFEEEGLRMGELFDYQPESEDGKEPDFLFPSEAAYKNPDFPPSQLRMLAVKTTCKDRWRQVLNEADRIGNKHLLTLQEGVSEKQFDEMKKARVKLVVPLPLHRKYPNAVRPHLQSISGFMNEVRTLQRKMSQSPTKNTDSLF